MKQPLNDSRNSCQIFRCSTVCTSKLLSERSSSLRSLSLRETTRASLWRERVVRAFCRRWSSWSFAIPCGWSASRNSRHSIKSSINWSNPSSVRSFAAISISRKGSLNAAREAVPGGILFLYRWIQTLAVITSQHRRTDYILTRSLDNTCPAFTPSIFLWSASLSVSMRLPSHLDHGKFYCFWTYSGVI